MPITCPGSEKVRFRFRNVGDGKQRLAFCDNKVVEVTKFTKAGKKVESKKVK